MEAQAPERLGTEFRVRVRVRRNLPIVAVACATALAACGGSTTASGDQAGADPPIAAPPGDWTTFNFNAQRSGVGPAATGITARNLDKLTVRRVQLDGTVDSSAIELHGITVRGRARDVAVVTTTYGRTIAFDPGTGTRLWEFVPSDISSYQGSFRITNATPLADPNRRYVYAASPDGLIHKLALGTGRQVRTGHWPVRVTFDPVHEKLGTALNTSGSSVVVTTGGYIGDAPPYQGHVVMINRSSGRITAVWNSLCSNVHRLMPPATCSASDSAIWARAGAVIEPGSHRILVATGNAPFNGVVNWGDSVLELSPDARRLLHNWTPTNQAQLEAGDTDLGSTAPAILPPTSGYRLAVQGGKDGYLALLNLNKLNATRGGASPRTGGELQHIPTPGSDVVLTAPAVWTHGGQTMVFVANDSGTTAYALVGGSRPHLTVAAENSTPGTSPVVAGGLLYIYDERDGALKIYEPTGLRLLTSLPAATGHWNSPIVVGGRIILPEGNANDHNASSGTIDIYHLPGH